MTGKTPSGSEGGGGGGIDWSQVNWGSSSDDDAKSTSSQSSQSSGDSQGRSYENSPEETSTLKKATDYVWSWFGYKTEAPKENAPKDNERLKAFLEAKGVKLDPEKIQKELNTQRTIDQEMPEDAKELTARANAMYLQALGPKKAEAKLEEQGVNILNRQVILRKLFPPSNPAASEEVKPKREPPSVKGSRAFYDKIKSEDDAKKRIVGVCKDLAKVNVDENDIIITTGGDPAYKAQVFFASKSDAEEFLKALDGQIYTNTGDLIRSFGTKIEPAGDSESGRVMVTLSNSDNRQLFQC